jgi:hypothetical protein
MVHRNKEMRIIENHREGIRHVRMEATLFVSLGHGLDGGLEGVSLGRSSLGAASIRARG